MAGKKDQVVVAVISGLTKTQAANVQAGIIKAKQKHGGTGRGTITVGSQEDTGKMLDAGQNAILQMQNKGVKKIGTKKG